MITEVKSWDTLSSNEKLDLLTTVLTRAGSDMDFRRRCLASSESARRAINEMVAVEFPPDFKIEFITPEQRMRRLILTMPDYVDAEDGVAEVRNAEDYQPCTYTIWRT